MLYRSFISGDISDSGRNLLNVVDVIDGLVRSQYAIAEAIKELASEVRALNLDMLGDV